MYQTVGLREYEKLTLVGVMVRRTGFLGQLRLWFHGCHSASLVQHQVGPYALQPWKWHLSRTILRLDSFFHFHSSKPDLTTFLEIIWAVKYICNRFLPLKISMIWFLLLKTEDPDIEICARSEFQSQRNQYNWN